MKVVNCKKLLNVIGSRMKISVINIIILLLDQELIWYRYSSCSSCWGYLSLPFIYCFLAACYDQINQLV